LAVLTNKYETILCYFYYSSLSLCLSIDLPGVVRRQKGHTASEKFRFYIISKVSSLTDLSWTKPKVI